MDKKPSKEIKAGNIRKALVGSDHYILEFISPERARAYTRKKNVNDKSVKNLRELKNTYAGEFIKGPPPRINPNVKENNIKMGNKEAPTENNIKKKNTTKKNKNKKPVSPVLKKAVAPPPVTVAKKTVKTTRPKTPPLPPYTGYFQRQEGAGCGRHALNNLLGRTAFVKGTLQDTYIHGTSKEPYSLLGICNTIEKEFKKKGLRQSCLFSENYDNNTMIAALDILGYETEVYTPSDDKSLLPATTQDVVLDESGDFLGFLVNPGTVKGKTKHWVALCFKKRTDNGTVLYDYYDSLNERPIFDIDYINIFSKEHPNAFYIKVLLPQGKSVDPTDRINMLPDIVPSPKVKATTKQLVNDCSVLYDPCTRQPVKDMAALEARIAEIKAKQVKV